MPGCIIAYKEAFILVDHILSPLNTFPVHIENVNPCELLKLPAVKRNAHITLKLPLNKIQKVSLFCRTIMDMRLQSSNADISIFKGIAQEENLAHAFR
jgi:hypothetical protein